MGDRCFLADEMIGDFKASEVLYEAARTHEINPVLLLARLQVEKSLISKTVWPGDRTMDYALGCGAFDDRTWLTGVKGLEKQLDCAAEILSMNYKNADALVSQWQPGVTKTSEDGHSITPANNATAALYAYTPWVYGDNHKGGNWLAWSVTTKYIKHLEEQEKLSYEAPGWIGSSCVTEDPEACDFRYRQDEAWCLSVAGTEGICTMACRGICQDHAGVETFCVDINGAGVCVPKLNLTNNFCKDIPHTQALTGYRFLGIDSAIPRMETVCMPAAEL